MTNAVLGVDTAAPFAFRAMAAVLRFVDGASEALFAGGFLHFLELFLLLG